ncbi:ATP-dependent zinc metalloprotease FtsH [Pseudocoprococcus immobilis]
MKNTKKRTIGGIIIIGLIIIIICLLPPIYKESQPYTQFMAAVDKNEVASIDITLSSNTFTYTLKDGSQYRTENPKYNDFKKDMLEKGIEVDEKKEMSNYMSFITIGMMGLFMIIMLHTISGREKTTIQSSSKSLYLSSVKFSDVAGHTELKKDLMQIIDFLKNPKIYKKAGAKLPKGILLYGPPGTGKTLLAKAIAGEASVNFRAVSGSDFDEKFVGVGAGRIRELFKWARKNSPCILFIDEIDALGGKRGGNISADRQTINALLSEMDGFTAGNGVLVVAATNRLQDLDPALTRPGRFDNRFAVPLPSTSKERREIIDIYTKDKNFDESVDLDVFAKEMVGASPAVIEAVINEAAILSAADGSCIITKAMLDEAYFKQLMEGHSKKDAERQQDEIKLTAYHEAGHALLGFLFGYEITKVSIVPSTSGAGGVTMFNQKKMGLYSKQELEQQVMTLYAGRLAEEVLVGPDNVTTGASNDIERASELLYDMVVSYGMGKEDALISYSVIQAGKSVITDQILAYSEKLRYDAEMIINSNKDKLKMIAGKLIENETIDGDELREIFE